MEERKASRELEITITIEKLGKEVQITMDRVKKLEERLQKIMRKPCPSEEANPEKVLSDSCEIATQIRDATTGIQFILGVINDLLERIEL